MVGLHNLFFVILTSFTIEIVASEDLFLPCTVPNETVDGVCLPKHKCAAYNTALNFRPLKSDRLSFLKQVQCNENVTEPFVCCTTNANYTLPIIELNVENRKFKNHSETVDLLANRFGDADACGVQSYQNRILGGDISEIDEFPWMALLFYAFSDDTTKAEQACGGVLISVRHVISAAHCLIGDINEKKGELKFVRLGEFNLDDNPDCIQELNEQDCADPPIDFGISNKIIHPKYRMNSKNHHHDIAIIKLDQAAPHTDFISPICLPQSRNNPKFKELFVSGWGRTGTYAFASPFKLRVMLPFVNNTVCSRAYQAEHLEIASSQICAGGRQGFDTCAGDSGSPLMHTTQNGNRWELVGVVSLGFKQCGLEGVPGVYTYIQHYIDWIKASIRR